MIQLENWKKKKKEAAIRTPHKHSQVQKSWNKFSMFKKHKVTQWMEQSKYTSAHSMSLLNQWPRNILFVCHRCNAGIKKQAEKVSRGYSIVQLPHETRLQTAGHFWWTKSRNNGLKEKNCIQQVPV